MPVHDTVKQVGTGDGVASSATLPRETLFLAQTPQAFRATCWPRRSTPAAGASGTDEAMLAEQAGHAVRSCRRRRNVKITTAADLERARARSSPPASASAPATICTCFVEGRPLILGGVRIPYNRGLKGHSDADAVFHAVTDAMLGAANLGDMGRLFPDTDPRVEGRGQPRAARRCRGPGARRRLHAGQPRHRRHRRSGRKWAARRGDREQSWRRCSASTPTQSAIKGKTNERVDATGRGEALAVHAVALIARAQS